MSLREQFASDLATVFVNIDEFGTWREFRISDGHGGFKVFMAQVVWDEEAAERQPPVTRFGVYLGDVVCFIEHKYLPRMPVAGELIYSPANQPWEVIKVIDEESCYKLMLGAYRSLPGKYGSN